MRSPRWLLLIVSVCLATGVLHCRQKPEPVPVGSFKTLPPELQQKLRQKYPNVDPEWQRIVERACKTSAFVNCVCCDPKTRRACNPTNWSCCGSAVFGPADGSSCAFDRGGCNCPNPNQAAALSP
jgi:hypothetical protein